MKTKRNSIKSRESRSGSASKGAQGRSHRPVRQPDRQSGRGERESQHSSSRSVGSGAEVRNRQREADRRSAFPRDESRRPESRSSEQSGATSARDHARWVVGLHSCGEALKVRPSAVREIWLRDDELASSRLREFADLGARHQIPVRHKPISQLDRICSGHQGVAVAVMESPKLDWLIFEGDERQIILVLDGIEDPHNLGSMLRTAWLTGVSALFIPEDRAVGLTPAACKVASGGAEHVPVESHSNLPAVIERLKERGFWVYGLSEKGERRPWDFRLPEKVVWVVGSEGSGMRISTERVCDELVRIPQVAGGSSYNASIAISMALSETCRQLGDPR